MARWGNGKAVTANNLPSEVRSGERHARWYILLAFLIEAAAGLAVCHARRLEFPLGQFELGIREMLSEGAIRSTFLPVGYPAVLGWAEMLGKRLPHVGPDSAVLAMQVGCMLLLLWLAQAVLRRFGSVRFAVVGALLIALDPQLMTFVKSVTDTVLTTVLLFALIAGLFRLRERTEIFSAVPAGLVLAALVAVRPNLILMVLLLPWAVWGRAARTALMQTGVALATAVLAYALFTTAVHGRPFFPQNGPYNLYAGANAYTADALARYQNAENSITPAMREKGIEVALDWSRQPDDPGRPDPRDARNIPFFRQQSSAFVRAHPLQMLRLTWLKLKTFFFETFVNHEARTPLFYAVTVFVKVICLLIAPVWFIRALVAVIHGESQVSWLFIGFTFLYILPFVLTNADPRFRIPLEAVLLIDLLRPVSRERLKGSSTAGGLMSNDQRSMRAKPRATIGMSERGIHGRQVESVDLGGKRASCVG